MTSNEFRRKNVEFALEIIDQRIKRRQYKNRAIVFVSVSFVIFLVLILIAILNFK